MRTRDGTHIVIEQNQSLCLRRTVKSLLSQKSPSIQGQFDKEFVQPSLSVKSMQITNKYQYQDWQFYSPFRSHHIIDLMLHNLMKSLRVLLLLTLIQMVCSHGSHPHHFHCQFDSLYKNLKPPANFSAKLDEGGSNHQSSSDNIHRRDLSIASRVNIRITLDTTNFSTLVGGSNGASATTQANLNFILQTATVVQSFLQTRLQVATVSRIYSPSTCVDFNPPSNDVTNGIAGSDLHIYAQYLTDSALSYGATGKSCKYFGSTGSLPTLVGLPDVTLQQGRPTVGRIKFNTYQLVDGKTLNSMLFQSVSSTALHEVLHILGFDSTLYPYFLDQGTSNVYSYSVQVTASTFHASRPTTTILTTPYVLAWAKSFFGCSSITGMQLENQDGTGLGAGSHWERVMMYDELMTATSFGAVKGMSALTFAILKDMGWYNVDDTFNETSNFGYQKGCTFYNDACYGTSFTDSFCDSASLANISRCQTTFYGKSLCKSQSSTMADGCGIYVPYYNCVDPAAVDDGYRAYTFQSSTTSSFCIYSTLSNVGLSAILQSRCYPYVCSTSSVTFTIGAYSITCLSTQAGVTKTLSALNGQLTCPVFADFCTNSRKPCPNWCSQKGYCMRGVCNCVSGYSGLDCSIQICTGSTYYYSINNSCLVSCPSGTYQDIYTMSCRACAATCAQCRNQPAICISCVSTIANPMYFYFTNSTCMKVCPTTTYTTGDICYDCNVAVSCKTCSIGANNCTSCLGGLFLSTPTFGTCGATCTGSYTLMDMVNFLCVSTCTNNLVLTGGNTCNLCTSGSYKFVANQSCISGCPLTYYADTVNRICLTCDSSCLNCDGKYPQNCTACNPTSTTKFLLLKMCLSICPRGFYQNTTAGACQICTIGLNCATCVTNAASLVVNCTTCAYGYYFQSNTCGTTCAPYFYKNSWNNSCTACSGSCGNCNGPSATQCTDCPGNFLLNNVTGSYCLAACPTIGYVTSSTNCLACDPTCKTCNGISSSNCVTCATGYYLSSSMCRLVCPGGSYPDSTTQQCLPCDGSCTYCYGSTINNCTKCISGMVLYNFTCQGSCPSGLTVNQWNVCFEKTLIASLSVAIAILVMIFVQ